MANTHILDKLTKILGKRDRSQQEQVVNLDEDSQNPEEPKKRMKIQKEITAVQL
jgi:hypothetical protein